MTESVAFPSTRAPVLRHQRVDGDITLAYRADAAGRTRLKTLYQRAPGRVLFPHVEPEEPPQAVIVNTSGGLTGGDRLGLSVEIGAGAAATVTSQAAEKYYRVTEGENAIAVTTKLDIAEGAWCDWLAQEAILFDGTKLDRRLEADIAGDGQLLAVESLVFGRLAMGERFDRGHVHDAWRIRRDGRLIWADAQHLDDDIATLRRRPFAFADATAMATLLYVGAEAGTLLPEMRDCLAGHPGLGAATTFDGMLIVRFLAADAQRLRRMVMQAAAFVRGARGKPATMPRVWQC